MVNNMMSNNPINVYLNEFGVRGGFNTVDKLDGIDSEKEYNLIKQKKSQLSSNMRDRVVRRYEYNERKK